MQVVSQQIVGKEHLKVTVAQVNENQLFQIKAIAWRWREYFPLPPRIDIAYRLRENTWNGNTTIELELVGVRLPSQSHLFFPSITTSLKTAFEYKQRSYSCGFFQINSSAELRIRNADGTVLAIESGKNIGLLGNKREDARTVDIYQPHFYNLVQAALNALEIAKTNSL